jgi:hypothetical protein
MEKTRCDRIELGEIEAALHREEMKGCFQKGDRHLEDSEPVPFWKRFLIKEAAVVAHG